MWFPQIHPLHLNFNKIQPKNSPGRERRTYICDLFLGVCFEYFSKKDAKYPLIEKSVSIRVLTL